MTLRQSRGEGTDEKKPSFYGKFRQASSFSKAISNIKNIEKAPDELKSFKLLNFWGHVLKFENSSLPSGIIRYFKHSDKPRTNNFLSGSDSIIKI